jgi:hypothetical protein
VDDFEAFKKKKADKEKADKDAVLKAAQDAKNDEAAKKMGWVDGFGFTGAVNPKVKGFVLGRSRKKKIDVKELKKPGNFESHRMDDPNKPKPTEPPKPPEKPKNYNKY